MSWTKPDTTTRPIAVIGGGVLGRRICLMWTAAGKKVHLYEKSQEVAKAALEYVAENVKEQATKNGTEPGTLTAIPTLVEAVGDAWMVIEAIPEILDIKIPLFGELDSLTKPDCILATNSSSYKSSEMIEKVTRKYRVCNTHYFMPPSANFVELMTCGVTEEAIFPFLIEETSKAGLNPAHAKVESTGFIFNRVWAAMKRECLLVMAEGVSTPATIDALFKGTFEADVGPCQMMDSVGLDTVYNIEKHYVEERGLDRKPMDWIKENYVDKGILGRKSGKGFLI